MLYNEFLQGTGCKDTPYNFDVYKALEALYMANDAMTKEAVYKAGKNLVDNSETPKERETRQKLTKEAETLKQDIEYFEAYITMYKGFIETMGDIDGAEAVKEWKREIKWRQEEKRKLKSRLCSIKSLFKEYF